ncbi:MAG: DUF523 and DUF1722 domain-containing protein [Planctomycetota bacterium]
MTVADPHEGPILVGISSCLLGAKVRYDGGHKRDNYITDILGQHFTFISVCPELEVGMGVPREPVRLVGRAEAPRMLGHKTGADWTDSMNRYAARRVRQSDLAPICGYILKKDSPSCGMERVKVYNEEGMPSKLGRGLFAQALMEHFPLLPIEEEGRLNDARLRENFIVRVFAFHRLRRLFSERFSLGRLVRFHTANKYLLLAHSPDHYKRLGQLVARAKREPPTVLRETYSRLFMEALAVRTTPRKNANVLLHILGFLKEHLGTLEKQDILAVIEDYRRGLLPLAVPLTLLKHYVNKHEVAFIQDQIYLNPHPKELMLRHHV